MKENTSQFWPRTSSLWPLLRRRSSYSASGHCAAALHVLRTAPLVHGAQLRQQLPGVALGGCRAPHEVVDLKEDGWRMSVGCEVELGQKTCKKSPPQSKRERDALRVCVFQCVHFCTKSTMRWFIHLYKRSRNKRWGMVGRVP